MIAIRAKKLFKSYESPSLVSILAGVDLEVSQGSSIAIMGRSGAGKTTLLHILGTLENYDQGTLEILGSEVRTSEKERFRREHLGFVFQSYHLLEDFTVIENVLMPARILRKPSGKKSAAYERAFYLLERVGLKERAHFPAKLLSGGEKQRASIARALANDPSILLADEPSGNLDDAQAQSIYQLLLDTVRLEHKTLVVVTHDENLAKLCDRTYVLSLGQLSPLS